MLGLEKILNAIEQEGRAEAEALCSRAEQEAQAIREKAMQEAQQAQSKRLAEGEREAQRAYGRVMSSAELAAQGLLLQTRQELLSACFQRAQEKLLAMPICDYEAFLCDLIVKTADGDEELALSKRDRSRINLPRFLATIHKKLKQEGIKGAALILSDEVPPIAGGFLLKKNDVTVNCSLEMLLAEKRESLEATLVEMLSRE